MHFFDPEIYQIVKFCALKNGKMEVSELLDFQKLISRKIWMTEKSWNFHTVHWKSSFFHNGSTSEISALFQVLFSVAILLFFSVDILDRRRRIHNKICEKFRIFLSLRFYVKSILEVLQVQNLTFQHIYGLWNLISMKGDFYEICTFERHTFTQINTSEP